MERSSPKLIIDTKVFPVNPKVSPPSSAVDNEQRHQIIRPTPRRAIDMSLNDNLRFVLGKSNTDPRRDQRKHPATEERPKSHSPTTEKEASGSPGSGGQKPVTSYGKLSPEYIKDRTSPPEKGSTWKNTSWSSADSIQHFPERDTSNQPTNFFNSENLVTNVVIGGNAPPPPPNQSVTVVGNSSNDAGYQILSRRDEEAERRNVDHPSVKVGRSSLVKYKANNRNKVKRKGLNGSPSKYQQQQQPYNQQHSHEKLTKSLENAHRLLDVKAAIEQLRLRHVEYDDDETCSNSGNSTSTYSTTGTSGSDSDPPRDSRIVSLNSNSVVSHHSSVTATPSGGTVAPQTAATPKSAGRSAKSFSIPGDDTANTTVASADEFVWIDSYNRLVELQKLPWNTGDIFKAISQGKDMSQLPQDEAISGDLLPRLSYYLQRLLVRVSREAQRLSKPIGRCGKSEISAALRIIITPSLAIPALKACMRAAAMFSISGDVTRQTKSSRAGLSLHVGKMHRWMCLVKVGKFVHESAAIYMTAAIESVLEELMARCVEVGGSDSPGCIGTGGREIKVNAALLEQTVSMSADFWGIFQPYSHLSSCRTANGLAIPRCFEEHVGSGAVMAGGHSAAMANGKAGGRTAHQALLTTCVGSIEELEELVHLVGPVMKKCWVSAGSSSSGHGSRPTPQSMGLFGARQNFIWNFDALKTLYHFIRCSQLEYVGQEGRAPIQELFYERPYMVLPPLLEWVRVSTAFTEYRHSTHVDNDDILQAARVLLPGMDHPVRSMDPGPSNFGAAIALDELEYVNFLKREMAFHMLQTGRRDLIPHALQLLPPGEKVNAANSSGLTSLQLAALRGDFNVARLLLETGADVDGKGGMNLTENKLWTPLNYAVLGGHHRVVKLLLDRGASVEGGAKDRAGIVRCSETPLQLAAAVGSLRIVELLLSHGASPFFSSIESSTDIGFAGSSSSTNGCYPPISVAATHGHKKILNFLISHAMTSSTGDLSQIGASNSNLDDVLSLEEILAEGGLAGDGHTTQAEVHGQPPHQKRADGGIAARLTKTQMKKLQEALYHACESTNLDLALDLRNLGIPWTLHTWLQTLQSANEAQAVSIINELLQDFSTQWPKENTSYFVDVGLPLLFTIFRNSKTEGTILLLADIFSACYGRSSIEPIDPPKSGSEPQPRIDPKFVNNPELSDVSFRVENRIFYAHKLVLVTASPRFQSMLNSRFCEGSPPVLQINDIRYDIFQGVMMYLYHGGSHSLKVEAGDVLELMAAANFFQLPGLLRYCEYRCSHLVDICNIVSYYIHAKVYNAVELLNYCEGFLLQNMVALLTYDDSVKRLLFGKKLQNHDVLSGLLITLQKRLKLRTK